ncbi:MAG: ATP-dependent helicase, partial [Patescibacteria group bacterium]
LLIIAGAGTGKTTVITERIKNLIFSKKAKPSEILALTFTEKAAREMEERVDLALPYGYTQMWISTFHSFCDRVLRDQALHIGLDPKYRLMTEANTVQLIRNNLFKFDLDYFRPLGNPTKFVRGMIQHFSRLQDEDVSPSEYLAWAKTRNPKSEIRNKDEKIEIQKWLELANAYKKYEEIKIQEGVMDFGDLIVKTLKLFRDRPNVLKEYKNQFKYILVDEFQDTNISQYELIKLLAPPRNNPNLSVVGDDSQSIYKFRGAAVSNILSFKKDYKKAKTVVLIKNYRSTQIILDAAYRLVQHNNPDTLETQLGISKNLKSNAGDKKETDVFFIHSDRVENEADQVAKEILRLIAQDRYKYRDFAILVRANNHSEPFARALSRHGIPYQFLGPGRLFKQPEVIDLISYLKVLYNFEDSVAFCRLLSIDYLNISSRDLAAIGNFARRFNLSLFEACDPPSSFGELRTTQGQGALPFVSSDTREKIQKILEIIHKHLSLIKKETAGQLLYYFLENSGLIQKLLSPDTPQAEKRALNISKFFDKLKTYEVDHEDATVSAVVDWIELSSDLGESPLAADIDWTNINAVNILTVHSSKGLEFPVVF